MSNDDKLPKGWSPARLGDLTEPSKIKVEPSSLDEGCSYIGLEHIEKKTGALLTHGSSEEVRSTKAAFNEGDVLYGRLRPYLNKVYLASFNGICSTDILVFPKTEFVCNSFLHLRMLSQDFVRYANSNASGVQHPRVSFKVLSNFEINLPPLGEQERIVGKVEELFSDLDAGVAALEVVKKEIKRYRQAVLKNAFEGKLTEKWRKENKDKIEPASKLLERIAKERGKQTKGKKQKKLPPLNTSALPELPDEWEWAQLDTIADVKGGITKDQKKRYKGGRIIPYLRVANVQRGYLDLSKIKDIEASEDIIDTLRLKSYDEHFTQGGDRDKLGRGCVWKEELPECIHQNHIFRARLYSADISSQIVSWFGNSFGQYYFMREGKQTTNLASINLTKLRAFPVPVIPIEEKEQIVSEIERCFSIADQSEKIVEEAIKQSQRLRQSILKRAFEGKLVPQDPNEEPAEKLLERIKFK